MPRAERSPLRLRSILLTGVLAVFVAACGGSASSSPAASSAAPAAPTDAPASVAPTVASSPAANASGGVELPHGAPELEATLPDKIHDATLVKFSLGKDDLGTNAGVAALTDAITAAGGDPASVQLAVANDAPAGTVNLIALRGDGVDGAALVTAYADTAISTGQSTSSSTSTVGGKAVTRLVSPAANPVGDLWIYAVGDTLYGVQSKDEALAAEVLAQLP